MAEVFLELFSEEIPSRMQQRGAEELARLLGEALAALAPTAVRSFYGPRRIAYAAQVAAGVAASSSVERGPRRSAPEQALAGFLRKHGAAREELREEGEFWVLHKAVPGVDAAALIAAALPGLLRRFSWPKSMRWGGTSRFTWVRPLRRITCLLDGRVVGFDLRDGDDDGHGLAAGNTTEGHRFLSDGPFTVTGCADWQARLLEAHVVVDAAERRARIEAGLAALAARAGVSVVPDAGLLDEVAGLVEWPVAMLGRIDPAYMDLPAEVMQVSMRVNQRYFALRDAEGKAAPYFAFVANVPGSDGGAAIVAGNERVLRARFSDARHFWDQDRKVTLESRVAALDAVTFHAKLGSQGERTAHIAALAERIALLIGADPALARRAAHLCKADLTTGMVGEFPEVQGVIGGYYARHDGEPTDVADAVAQHYQPKG
ncbi:MAG TPA: glycine--tRNA ligase subunit beta, partial [Acetobacteraceae bacterium]|nr:glycine--tRNA ligase subunit beta [Acetobacteraceae bacterium]